MMLRIRVPSTGLLSVSSATALTATNIDAGAPTLGTPSIGQTHTLTSTTVNSGVPTLGTPTIAQAHVLTGTTIDAGTPTLGTATLGQTHALVSVNLSSGDVVIVAPDISETHALESVSISLSYPVISNPTLGASDTVYSLVSKNIEAQGFSDVWSELIEGDDSAADILRLVRAFIAGKATVPNGDGSFAFRDAADTKNRIAGTIGSGARTITGVDPT